MATLQELMAQRAELEAKIHEMTSVQRVEALAKIKEIMAEYGLTLADIAGKVGVGQRSPRLPSSRGVKAGSVVAAKYRNPATGETWSGRGLKPRWLTAQLAEGKQLSDFLIGAEPAPPAANSATSPEQALEAALKAEEKKEKKEKKAA